MAKVDFPQRSSRARVGRERNWLIQTAISTRSLRITSSREQGTGWRKSERGQTKRENITARSKASSRRAKKIPRMTMDIRLCRAVVTVSIICCKNWKPCSRSAAPVNRAQQKRRHGTVGTTRHVCGLFSTTEATGTMTGGLKASSSYIRS